MSTSSPRGAHTAPRSNASINNDDDDGYDGDVEVPKRSARDMEENDDGEHDSPRTKRSKHTHHERADDEEECEELGDLDMEVDEEEDEELDIEQTQDDEEEHPSLLPSIPSNIPTDNDSDSQVPPLPTSSPSAAGASTEISSDMNADHESEDERFEELCAAHYEAIRCRAEQEAEAARIAEILWHVVMDARDVVLVRMAEEDEEVWVRAWREDEGRRGLVDKRRVRRGGEGGLGG
ncbi:MAG: hypothetical protein M1835_007990 [Candelina submexicana]|nr:MAG: hypothetical protein M1835_007990 [Candelina submexicana]